MTYLSVIVFPEKQCENSLPYMEVPYKLHLPYVLVCPTSANALQLMICPTAYLPYVFFGKKCKVMNNTFYELSYL